jgi:hypothetical protein
MALPEEWKGNIKIIKILSMSCEIVSGRVVWLFLISHKFVPLVAKLDPNTGRL